MHTDWRLIEQDVWYTLTNLTLPGSSTNTSNYYSNERGLPPGISTGDYGGWSTHSPVTSVTRWACRHCMCMMCITSMCVSPGEHVHDSCMVIICMHYVTTCHSPYYSCAVCSYCWLFALLRNESAVHCTSPCTSYKQCCLLLYVL